jgi:hypothetical protein
MTGYYDIVLGLIPLALVGITGALVLAGVGLTTAVPLAATVAVGLVGHALFVRSPTDGAITTASTIRPERARERSPVNAD